MTFLEVLLAVFLPPVAVLLRAGFGLQLLLSIILTIIGWIPGVIHALWVLSSRSRVAHA
ncbi:MAG TPA: YqaE/Pmp3 family membrane protein [Thermoanaerobaculia bacterium]|jgi:uncharacterized membrane protein YqaE (UPF0057 family)|nr:YqaE/Pmp3 family membrane protein [Thermoanaerobaculia bacterium]